MLYTDRIYGQIKIKEPVILELIKSPSLQRLDGVDQAGYFEPHFAGTAFSRFEHSLGVFILLNKFAGLLEEQIAGLIHDVSHAAFSHCIDYVLDKGSPKEHDHQDNIFREFVSNSEIPQILSRYSIDINYVLDEANFPLKETDLPDLCADRIDYSLRTAFVFKEVDQDFIDKLLDDLLVENKRWVFKNLKSAQSYAQLFWKLNKKYYAGFPSAVMFRTVGDFLKHALDKGYIKVADLYTTDKEVIQKIKKYLKVDKKLALFWKRMNNKVKTQNNPEDFEASIFCKSRIVDPLFKRGKRVIRLSDQVSEWKKIVDEETRPKEYFIKFLACNFL